MGWGRFSFFIAASAAFFLVAAPAIDPAFAGRKGKGGLSRSVGSISKSVSKSVGGLSKGLSKSTSSLGKGLSGGSQTKSGATTSVGGKAGVSVGLGSTLLGGTKVGVSALGPDGVASVDVRNGATGLSAGVLRRGQLASLGLDADSPPGAGSPGKEGITPAYARAIMADLNRIERQALRLRCADVLRSPKAFDADLILLCRILKSI